MRTACASVGRAGISRLAGPCHAALNQDETAGPGRDRPFSHRQCRAQGQETDLVTTLSGIERSLWKGWAEHDTAPFGEHLTDPAVNVGPSGTSSGKDGVLAFIAAHDCEVAGYSSSDWSVHRVTDDVVLLTYRATQDAACGGRGAPLRRQRGDRLRPEGRELEERGLRRGGRGLGRDVAPGGRKRG